MNKKELGRLIELYMSRIGKLEKLFGFHSPFMAALIKAHDSNDINLSPLFSDTRNIPSDDSLSFIFYALCYADLGEEIDDCLVDWTIVKRDDLKKKSLLSPDKLVALILLHSTGKDDLAESLLQKSDSRNLARAFFILAKAGIPLTEEGFCCDILKSKLPVFDAKALVDLRTAGVPLEELPNLLKKPQLHRMADTAVKLHSIGMPYNQEFIDEYISITSSYVTQAGLEGMKFLKEQGIALPSSRVIAVLSSARVNVGYDVLALDKEELLSRISDEQFAKIINQKSPSDLIKCLSQLNRLGKLNLSEEQITYIINLSNDDRCAITNRIFHYVDQRISTLSTEQLDRIIRAVTREEVAKIIEEARLKLGLSILPVSDFAKLQQVQSQPSGSVSQPSQGASFGDTTLFKPVARAASPAAIPALQVLEYDKDADIPPHYICPITYELMIDPVVARDGHTYECAAIKEWLQTSNNSPMTGVFLESKELIPNFTLKSMIRDWCHKNPPRNKESLSSK
jgi:hypothetical protein